MLSSYETSATAEPIGRSEWRSTLVIGYVEDNADLQAFLKGQLNTIYRVETADNSEEGLVESH